MRDCAQPAMLTRLAQSFRSDDGRPVSISGSDSVRQHLRTALSLIQDLVVEPELGARLKELQPYIEQTMHDVHRTVPLGGKPAEPPINGLKTRCEVAATDRSATQLGF